MNQPMCEATLSCADLLVCNHTNSETTVRCFLIGGVGIGGDENCSIQQNTYSRF